MVTRSVSVVAAVVVFVTTYALVLPAITMEQNASCGIPEHQHIDACYEDQLVCGIPEGHGHHHDVSCYEKILICGLEAHVHSPECYQQDSSMVVSSGSGEAASNALGAAGQPDVLYGTDGSEYDPDAFVRDGSVIGEEGMEGFAAEESAAEESASNQPAAEEPGAEQSVPMGSDAEESSTEKSAPGEAASGVTVPDGSEWSVLTPDDPENSEGRDAEENSTAASDSGETALEDSAAAASTVSDQGTAVAVQEMQGTEDTSFKSGTLTSEGDGYKITLDYTEKAMIPQNAELSVCEITTETDREAYEACLEQAGQQVAADDNTSVDRKASRFFDIEILVRDTDSMGNEEIRKIEPSAPVGVNIQIIDNQAAENDSASVDKKIGQSDPAVLHFAEEGVEQLDAEVKESQVQEQEGDKDKNTGEQPEPAAPATEISFEAESFSIYAVVYTVDFHWEVDGKEYEFSIPGGGFVSFTDLMEVLGVAGSKNNADSEETKDDETGKEVESALFTLRDVVVSDTTKKFVADVETVQFSSPELLSVVKVKEDATVGAIKDGLKLKDEYSADLTEDQIKKIDAQNVKAGDWALISLKPFTSEETLTVTMKDGETFTIQVTDAQISANVLTADGQTYKITVTFDDDAKIPAGTKLVANEIKYGTDEYIQHLGQTWLEINKEYFEVEEMRKNYNEEMGFLPEVHLTNVDSARYFDIKLIYKEKEIEPSSPVHIEIDYLEGLQVDDNSTAGIAHFAENGLEIIDDVETKIEDSSIVSFSYDQESFSYTGTYVGHETHDLSTQYASTLTNTFSNLSSFKAGEGTADSEEDGLPKPTADKTLKPNTANGKNDGTYTLTLSVSGSSKQSSYSEVTKSNVLIVMDRSSSMTSNFTYVEADGAHDSNLSYYGVLNGNISDTNRVELNYWSNTYHYYSRSGWHDYYGTVYNRKTRLAAEQDALATLIKQLTDKNMPGQSVTDEEGNTISLDDIIEVKLISFASGRTDQDKANGFKRNGKTVDTKGTTFENTESEWGRTYSNGSTLKEAVTDNSVAKGTNWEEALEYAKEVADAKKAAQPDEPVYVIFLTDGEPTDIHGDNGNAQWYTDNVKCLQAAEPDAKAIVDAHNVTTTDGKTVSTDHKFYGIFTYGDTDLMKSYLRRLVNYAYGKSDVGTENLSGGTADYYFDADNTNALLNAFQHILSRISNSLAYGKVSITDGLTTDAMTTTLVHGKAEGYKYTVTGAVGELYSVTALSPAEGQTDPTVTFTINGHDYPGEKKSAAIDGTDYDYWSYTVGEGDAAVEYKMTLADVSTDGKLTWDLSGIGTLMDGYTYSASFVVWPDQEAYDYVAGLNNGLPGYTWSDEASTYEDLTATKGYEKGGVERFPSIVKYPNEIYAVLTNTEQKVQYSIVDTKTENGVTTTTYDGPYDFDLPTPNPMPLTASSSQVEKVWNVNRDPDILAQLLYGDPEHPYSIGFDIYQDDNRQTPYTSVRLGWDEEQKKYIWKSEDHLYVRWDETKHKYVACSSEDEDAKEIGTHWTEEFSIATGLMLSEARMTALGLDKTAYTWTRYPEEGGTKYYLLEEGHDYTISEPSVGYEFDFDAPVYHPMLVDGVLTNVDFENIEKDSDGRVTSYNITGMSSINVAADGRSALTVVNTLRGYLNLEKRVLDNNGDPDLTDDTEFEFTLTVSNDDGLFEGDHIPWFAVNDCFYHTVDEDEEWHYYQVDKISTSGIDTTWKVTTEEGSSGPTYTFTSNSFDKDIAGKQTITCTNTDDASDTITLDIYGNQTTPYPANSHTKIKLTRSIRQDQKLTIGNIPAGSKYTVEESGKYGYVLKTTSGNTSGTIVPNSDTHVIFTNQKTSTNVNILKKKETGEGLSGAIFQLRAVKKNEGSNDVEELASVEIGGIDNFIKEIDGKQQEFKSAFETTDKTYTLTNLPDGTYRLYEVYVPAGYINTLPYIEFDVANGVAACSMADGEEKIDFDSTGTISLITITNTPGAALPYTGGPGTCMIYLSGMALICLAAAGLVMKRRRKAA